MTKTLTLSVRAGVTLRIAPRTASVGRSIRFSGRLRGGPIPSGGKLLVLEARSRGGPWLEFDVIRSDARGRYHASYRFKFPGPADYQFRVLCEAEADYPVRDGLVECGGCAGALSVGLGRGESPITCTAVKAVILAGGFGSRLSEETAVRPKPMVEIGGKPMLWHIMKIYAAHGIEDFVICLGYKGYLIKEYFANYYLHTCDVSFDLAKGDMEVHRSETEPWRVTLVDTGEQTMTGGRLQRVLPYVGEEDFCFTYGDGVADVDITALIAFHREQGTQGDRDRRAAAGPLRRARCRRRARARVRREATRGRRLDQRRLLRALAGDRPLPRGRRHGVGAGADADPRARGTARLLPPRRVLAGDGHAARPQPARAAVELRESAVADMGLAR